jgi:hypothetical protein
MAGAFLVYASPSFVREKVGDNEIIVKPLDFNISVSPSIKINQNNSISLSLKYYKNSALGKNQPKYGNAFGGDFHYFFSKTNTKLKNADRNIFMLGLSLTDIGTKVNTETNTLFLPMKINLGFTNEIYPTRNIGIAIGAEISKSLVPYQPVMHNKKIIKGISNSSNIFQAIAASFNPHGEVYYNSQTKEYEEKNKLESFMKTIDYRVSLELFLQNMFALRAGYQHVSNDSYRGNIVSTGFGFKHKSISIDIAYSLPFFYSVSMQRDNISISLGINF